MANAPNTNSTLSFDNNNKTSTALSTNILIMVGPNPVGAIQSLTVNEDRPLKMIDEVGTDGHIDSSPTGSTNITGDCTRIRFDRYRIAEAFGRGFVHVHSQVYPFDIMIIDRQSSQEGLHVNTIIKNVWIKNISYTYQQNDWIISEKMTWEAETIHSFLNGNKNVAIGGARGTGPLSIIPIERDTDIGKNGRRGSLDANGLIDIGSGGLLF